MAIKLSPSIVMTRCFNKNQLVFKYGIDPVALQKLIHHLYIDAMVRQ